MIKNLPLSYVEISKENLVYNIRKFRKTVHKKTKIAVAVKSNSYGHGQEQIVKILERFADYFFVNNIEELELLRKISKKQTFILGYVQKNDLEKAIKLDCILSIFSIHQLRETEKITGNLKIKQEIHLPIDAHLGREGFLLNELPEIFEEIKKSKNIKLSGIYAHFANLEDTTDFSHAKIQIDKYKQAIKLADKSGFKNLQTHISATSGLLIHEKGKGIHLLIRLGIGIYGMWPSERIKLLYKNKLKLKPVLSWKTKIAQIKILPKGATIGYGLTYKTKKTNQNSCYSARLC